MVTGGKISFADETDLVIRSKFIQIVNGEIEAGTPEKPHQHELVFEIYGDESDKSIPLLGRKNIACWNCKISLHGVPRSAWTTLESTLSAQTSMVSVTSDVDWKKKDKLIVAPSGLNNETEIFEI